MAIDDEIAQSLAELESAGLLRTARRVHGRQGPEMDVDGHRVLCLCSNNYLGLASHPDLVRAAREAIEADGVGAGASRLISGTMASHVAAEERLASFAGTAGALLFSTGWAANVGTLSALLDDESDVVFSDELNHASLIDGCRLCRARVVVYPHRDMDRLAELLATQRPGARRAMVVTDGVFSMDGDLAPLSRLREMCDAADAWLMVDEAHSLGVLGPSGRGLCAAHEVRPDVLVGTLGKAFGVAGAFVGGSSNLIRLLLNRARSLVFSTAPPPALAAATIRALELVEDGDDLRERLHGHADHLRAALTEQGWKTGGEGTPIVPVRVGRPDTTMRVSSALFERGVFAHGIRPPTVPAGTSRIRLVPMATHDRAQVQRVVDAFAAVRAEFS